MVFRPPAKRISEDEAYKNKVEDSLTGLRSYIDNTNKSIADVLQRLEANKLSSQIIDRQIEESVKKIHADLSFQITDYKEFVNQKLTDISAKLNGFVESSLCDDKFLNQLVPLKEEIKNVQKEVSRFKSELLNNVSDIEFNLKSSMNSFIKRIEQRPPELDALKAYLEEKLSTVAMDGSNAVLRSTVCERQINLIEKKIEQIFLLIKKLDLDKKET